MPPEPRHRRAAVLGTRGSGAIARRRSPPCGGARPDETVGLRGRARKIQPSGSRVATAWAGSASGDRPTAISRIGLAASPSTAVEPMCSIAAACGPRASDSSAANRWNASGHLGSLATSRTVPYVRPSTASRGSSFITPVCEALGFGGLERGASKKVSAGAGATSPGAAIVERCTATPPRSENKPLSSSG
jgi:hypothetical protein